MVHHPKPTPDGDAGRYRIRLQLCKSCANVPRTSPAYVVTASCPVTRPWKIVRASLVQSSRHLALKLALILLDISHNSHVATDRCDAVVEQNAHYHTSVVLCWPARARGVRRARLDRLQAQHAHNVLCLLCSTFSLSHAPSHALFIATSDRKKSATASHRDECCSWEGQR